MSTTEQQNLTNDGCGKAVKDLSRPIVTAIGLLLLAAGGAASYSLFAQHFVQGATKIGLVLAGGSILSAAFCLLDRSGESSLLMAVVVFLAVSGPLIFMLPRELIGFDRVLPVLSLSLGSILSITVGGAFLALALRW